jgi:vacuolar-type H+-ATPase subunit I/STV1
MMNDTEYFEQWWYKDTIDVYNSIIDELQKTYEVTSTTDRYARDRIESELKQSKSNLAKTQAQYEMFKKYKARTAISK